ncbi:MAG TPA: ATP-binding protein [Prosthecobacter sp.]
MTTHLVPTPCQADAEPLVIVANNLIANALQHGGNVTITCQTENNQAMFTVQDDGPGIAETDLPHIFERFYRADQARTTTSGHSGLGLAITKAIIDSHGGSMRVSSRVGEGAVFEVRLPRL